MSFQIYSQLKYPFELPELPYPLEALEPSIDARTMAIHHGKHHAGYVSKLNTALQDHTGLHDKSLTELLTNSDELADDIRQSVINNGGGHFNHTLFWDSMSPDGGGRPTGELATEINKTFGSFEQFKQGFAKAAATQFGSGWAWLIVDTRVNQLKIASTANQDSPLMQNHTPLLGLDVWEHAYYLNYQNRRADYIKAWWNVVNWEKVSELYLNLTRK